jgi:hypothetical protein
MNVMILQLSKKSLFFFDLKTFNKFFSFSFSIMQLLNQVFLNTFASNERLARLKHDQ